MLTLSACQFCSEGKESSLRCRAEGWLPNRAVLSFWNRGSPTPTDGSFVTTTYGRVHTQETGQPPKLPASAGTARPWPQVGPP